MDYERHKTKINIEIQKELSPYARLFVPGESVSLRDIVNKAPHTLIAVELLIEDGRVTAERTTSGEVILKMRHVEKN